MRVCVKLLDTYDDLVPVNQSFSPSINRKGEEKEGRKEEEKERGKEEKEEEKFNNTIVISS